MSDKAIIWTICGLCFIVLVVVWGVVEAVRAKYYDVQTDWPNGEYNGPVYDLYQYTQWLAEKGALREGFGEEHLVNDYTLNIHAPGKLEL